MKQIKDFSKLNFIQVDHLINWAFIYYSNYKDYKLYRHYYYINKQPVGLVYGWHRENYLFIDIVYVDEKHRKKGIATKMLKEVVEEVKSIGGIEFIQTELVKCYGKYMLKDIVENLDFILNFYYYFFKGRFIYTKYL